MHRAPEIHFHRDPRSSRQIGVTFIEIVIVVMIIAILLTLVVPGFSRFLSSHRASSATNHFVHAIALARGEALRRSRRVYLAPVGAHWRDGWVVFVDRNDNRVFDPPSATGGDELIVRHDPLPSTIAIINPANPSREPFTDVGAPQRTYLMFDGAGYARQRNGGLLLGSMAIVDTSGSAQTIRTVCLAAYGRVRIVPDHVGCS